MGPAHSHGVLSLQADPRVSIWDTSKCFSYLSMADQCLVPQHGHLLLPHNWVHCSQLDDLHNIHGQLNQKPGQSSRDLPPSSNQEGAGDLSLLTIPRCCLLKMCVQHCFRISQCRLRLDSMHCPSDASSLWPPDLTCISLSRCCI